MCGPALVGVMMWWVVCSRLLVLAGPSFLQQCGLLHSVDTMASSEQIPPANGGSSDPFLPADGSDKPAIGRSLASYYLTELTTGKHRRHVQSLPPRRETFRFNALKMYKLSLAPSRQRALDTKLAGLDVALKHHITDIGKKTVEDVNSHVTSEADTILSGSKEKTQPLPDQVAMLGRLLKSNATELKRMCDEASV